MDKNLMEKIALRLTLSGLLRVNEEKGGEPVALQILQGDPE